MPGSGYIFTSDGVSAIERTYKLATKAATESSTASIRAAMALAAGEERAAQKRISTQAKVEAAAKKSAERVAAAGARASEKMARAEQRANEKRDREAERSADKRIRLEQKVAKETERAAIKAAKAKEKADREGGQWKVDAARMTAGLSRHLAYRGADMALSTVGAAARESFNLQAIANRVSINSRGVGEAGVDPTQLRKQFEDAAIATPGIKAEDIGLATQKYVDFTGDLKTATDSMKTFATVASATATPVEEVALLSASLGKQFKITNASEMQKALTILTFQGKGAALTLAEMSVQFQKLAAAAGGAGFDKSVEGMAKLGGILQVARSGTGNARQAATATENIVSRLGGKALGRYAYDKKGHMMDPDQALANAIAGEGGSNMNLKRQLLKKEFGSQGMRAINPLLSAYTSASDAAGGGKKGQEAGKLAVLEALDKATKATSDYGEMQKDAAQAQRDAVAQMTGAWEKLKQKVGADVVPALGKLIPKVLALAEAVPLSTILTTFAHAIEGATIAAEGITGVLKILGLAEEKKLNPAERLALAKDKLAEFDKKNYGDAKVMASNDPEREALVDAVDKADKEAFKSTADSGYSAKGPKGAEDWAKRYAVAGGGAVGSEQYNRDLATAKGLAGSNMATIDGGQAPIIGRNDAQRMLVSGRQDEDRLKQGQGQNATKGLDVAFAAYAASVAKSKTANDTAAASAMNFAKALDAAGGAAARSEPMAKRAK